MEPIGSGRIRTSKLAVDHPPVQRPPVRRYQSFLSTASLDLSEYGCLKGLLETHQRWLNNVCDANSRPWFTLELLCPDCMDLLPQSEQLYHSPSLSSSSTSSALGSSGQGILPLPPKPKVTTPKNDDARQLYQFSTMMPLFSKGLLSPSDDQSSPEDCPEELLSNVRRGLTRNRRPSGSFMMLIRPSPRRGSSSPSARMLGAIAPDPGPRQ